MNGVSTDFIETIAEGLGITATKEALRSLSLDVEYKIRDIIQVRNAMIFVDVRFNPTGASDCDCLLSVFSTRIRLPGNQKDPQLTQMTSIMHLETLMWRYVATDERFLCPAKCFKEAKLVSCSQCTASPTHPILSDLLNCQVMPKSLEFGIL